MRPEASGRRTAAAARLLVALLALVLAACGGYATRLAEVRGLAQAGAWEEALAGMDPLVDRVMTRPRQRDRGSLPLLLLERAALRQATGDHGGAAVDFTEADRMLEVLDMTGDPLGTAAELLFSGSRSLYRPPMHEVVLVQVSNVLSRLHTGDVQGAMVEARRFEAFASFLQDKRDGEHPSLGLAWYVGGLAMEAGGDRSAALRWYLRARERIDAPGLDAALVRLAAGSTLQNRGEIRDARERLGAQAEGLPAGHGELVLVALTGLPPYRVPSTFPLGFMVASFRDAGYDLPPDRQAALNRAIAEDLLTFVNFPELVVPVPAVWSVSARVGARTVGLRPTTDVAEWALAWWERMRPRIAIAAVSRALARVLAREAIQAGTRQADSPLVRTLGFIGSLVAQGALTAADQPDTRNWSFMPARVWMQRTPLPAGIHRVEWQVFVPGDARVEQVEVDLPAGAVRVVVIRTLY